mmetsp:Transcript_36459/g.84120  ORF Transcript_36459/g.84120 Transcript_36459/m.84120 type:complete len:199 (+) Transcript_36459:925-1521(+)
MLLLDSFAREYASNPSDVDLARKQWTCITAFTGQVSSAARLVYLSLVAFSCLSWIPPLAEILPDGGATCTSCTKDWLLPLLLANIAHFFLVLAVLQSAAAVSQKCDSAMSFVNQLQCVLPRQLHMEHSLLVTFIERSDAGIFMGGMKVTNFLLVKTFSILATAVSAFGARLVSLPERHQAELREQLGRFLHAFSVWTY